jgi:hypothetical protein
VRLVGEWPVRKASIGHERWPPPRFLKHLPVGEPNLTSDDARGDIFESRPTNQENPGTCSTVACFK